MKNLLLYGDFLYFPEDKSTYIPAIFEFLIVLVLCIFAFMMVRKISKRQELKTKELEEKILKERQQQHNQS